MNLARETTSFGVGPVSRFVQSEAEAKPVALSEPTHWNRQKTGSAEASLADVDAAVQRQVNRPASGVDFAMDVIGCRTVRYEIPKAPIKKPGSEGGGGSGVCRFSMVPCL